jgi:hypothetical protein
MSVFIAKKLAAQSLGHSSFQIRNIKGYTKAMPSEVFIRGVPNQIEAAYAAYKTHIDVFIGANLGQKALLLTNTGCAVGIKGEPILPVGPFFFQSGVNLSADAEERLLTRIDGISKEKVGKVTKFQIKVGSAETIEKILSFAHPTFSPGNGEMSVQAADLAMHLLFFIRGFLATNQYPAFSTPKGAKLPEDFAGTLWSLHEESGGTAGDYIDCRADEVSAYQAKRRRLELEAKMEETRTKEEIEILSKEEVRAVKITSHRDAVWKAPVKKGRAESNYGPVGQIPNLPGLVFPYFEGMNAPDPLTLKMSLTLFFRLLGKDFAECKKRMADFRQYTTTLAGSTLGQEIVHIITGVQLALDTQTRLFVVVEGGYKGFVLLGAEFAVFDGTRWVESVSAADLRVELSAMDTHSAALRYVCDWMSALAITGEEDVQEVDASSITSAQQLIKQIQRRTVSDEAAEDLENIDAKMKALYFGGGYTDVNVDSLCKFMRDFLNPEIPTIPTEGALFLTKYKMNFEDRFLMHLSRFGPEAPVPMTSNGSEFAVPSPSSKVDPIFDPEDGGVPLQALPFYMKPIITAANDWRGIQKKKVVMLNLKERAGPYKSHFFKDLATKRRLWAEVRKVAFAKREQEEAADADRLKKKLKVSSQVDVLSLFD